MVVNLLKRNLIGIKKLINRNIDLYIEHPKTKEELRKILEERLKEDKNICLNDIDVSNIDDMSNLFIVLDPHNIDISDWDISNVTDMRGMFYCCHNFISDLSNWNVRNVKDMCCMFDGCKSLKKKPDWYEEVN